MRVDVLLFGGGIAGLWLLDELRRAGYGCVLVETAALGGVQSIASQGIIHGGLKYMFDGNVTPSASSIADMPALWRASLAGKVEPNLSGAKVLSDYFLIWGAKSLLSPLLLLGSRLALRTKPAPVTDDETPELLRDAGPVLRVDEQVIDCESVVAELVRRNQDCLYGGDPQVPPVFAGKGGAPGSVTVAGRNGGQTFEPARIVFCAGEGNASLREHAGLSASLMQRRPLRMVMVRGILPPLFAHCIGHPKPRLTITSARDGAGKMVWHIGGKLAEDGVAFDEARLLELTRKELGETLPALNLDGLEWAAYRINRAEAATNTGQKPDDVQIVQEGNIVTAWPTKLALAPRLAARIRESLPRPACEVAPVDGPTPPLARPPWETAAWRAL